ncbi:MAG TPA: hypothetical protein PKD23_06870 [Bellilinea sp.]|nr:hypothetical protein [Bellilinea sp.]
MNEIRDLHNDAMEQADLALINRLNGDFESARKLFLEAFSYEAEVANYYLTRFSEEPTRSVIFRSAAALALDAGLLSDAEKYAASGLSGAAPDDIKDQLREIIEKANFNRHLSLKGLELEPNEFQFVIAGNSTYAGVAKSDEVLDRVVDIKTLFYRTMERQNKKPYRNGGVSPYAEKYPVYLSSVRPSSFAITLRIGSPDQDQLPYVDEHDPTAEVIREFLDCIELVNHNEEKELRERIPDDAYYNNFLSLAQNMAPDGENVSIVGFTSSYEGKERRVELSNKRDSISGIARAINSNSSTEKKRHELIGRLLFAEGTDANSSGKIRLNTAEGKLTIKVPEGMDDIVMRLWNHQVKVIAIKVDRRNYLMEKIEANDT